MAKDGFLVTKYKIEYMQKAVNDIDQDDMDTVIRNATEYDEDWDAGCIFPMLVDAYAKGNDDGREGIDKACEAIFGWNLFDLAMQITGETEE